MESESEPIRQQRLQQRPELLPAQGRVPFRPGHNVVESGVSLRINDLIALQIVCLMDEPPDRVSLQFEQRTDDEKPRILGVGPSWGLMEATSNAAPKATAEAIAVTTANRPISVPFQKTAPCLYQAQPRYRRSRPSFRCKSDRPMLLQRRDRDYARSRASYRRWQRPAVPYRPSETAAQPGDTTAASRNCS